MEHRFHAINVPSQQRSKRIEEETWETCKEDILREFRSHGAQGVAQALRWIKSQHISGFNPNSRQLRHRILEVWKAERFPSARTPQAVKPDSRRKVGLYPKDEDAGEILAQPDVNSRSLLRVVSVLVELAEGVVEVMTEDAEVEENPKASYFHNQDSSLSTGNFNMKKRQQSQDSDTQPPLKRQNAGLHANTARERTNIVPVSILDPAKHSEGVVPTYNHWANQQLDSGNGPYVPRSTGADSLTSGRFSISHGHNCCPICDSGDIPNLSPIQDTACRKKRMNQSEVLSRPNMAYLLTPGGETLSSLRVDTEEHLETRETSTTESENIPSPQAYLENKPVIAKDLLNPPELNKSYLAGRPFTRDRDFMPDPVIKPTRLQRLLAKIGINWHLDVVTQWLSKASVVQYHGFPIRRYTKVEIHKIQTFAEILFASSNLDDAFPLFHQAWVAQGGGFNLYLAVQCAQSANKKSDRLLMVTILERLELSNPEGVSIHHQLLDILTDPDYRPIYDIRRRNLWDTLSSRVDEISRDPAMFHEESLHIRQCLQSADSILENPSAMQSRELWRVKIVRTWPKCPRPSQIALFFYLLDNWSTDIHPTADILLRCDRLSEFDILHAISFLVDDVDKWIQSSMRLVNLHDWFNNHDTSHQTTPKSVKETLLLLLSKDDRTLLAGFHKASLFLNMNIARKASESKLVTIQYRELVVDSFTLRYRPSRGAHGDHKQPYSSPSPSLGLLRAETMMSVISVNPTLAKSLSTCSTLESMRRLSTVTFTSFAHRWSRFSDVAMSLDELSDQASLMSISNGGSVPSVLESIISNSHEESPNASAESLVVASIKPPVPIFWPPTGMIRETGNRRTSLPTPVDHVTHTLVSKRVMKQFWVRERNSA